MAWTSPRTWSVGETPTASIFNTHVRDNLNAIYSGCCQVRLSGAQSHTSSGNWQTIGWDAEDFDTDAFHSGGANSRITIPSGLGGIYLVTVTVCFAAAASVTIGAKILKNGADADSVLGMAVGTNGTGLTFAKMMSLAAADYIEAAGYQASGGTLAFQVGATGGVCSFSAQRVHI